MLDRADEHEQLLKDVRKSVARVDSILDNVLDEDATHPGAIIADVYHWCDAHGIPHEEVLRHARSFYQDETTYDNFDRALFTHEEIYNA